MLLVLLTVQKLYCNVLRKRFAKKKNQKEFRVENVIKGKRDKLYVKWKGYNNSFNSRVDIKKSFNKMS